MSKEAELGTLIVVILKARNLNDKHSFYKQDVFAQATLNGVTKKTPVDVKGGQHPVWDAEIRFSVMKQAGDKHRKLEVACFAKEPRSDDILGKGTIDITETLKTGEFDEWVSLNIDGVVRGDLYLEMTYFANSPAPVTNLAAPPSGPTRRPSKLAPAERLYRHPAAQPPAQPRVENRPHQGQWGNAYGSDGTYLEAPSPPSSRSSSAGSLGRRSESPLPPLPEEGLPPGRLPSNLLPGRGRPTPQAKPSPHAPSPHTPSPNPVSARVPTTLRPGKKSDSHITSSQTDATHSRHSSGGSTPDYHAAPSSQKYGYTAAQLLPSSPYSSHTPSATPGPAVLYPPPVSTTPQLWAPADSPSSGSFSFPVPTVAPVHAVPGYNANANASPPSSSYQPPLPPPRSDLPDPYLQVRYQTPLPLPPGSTSPPRGRQSLPRHESPDHARVEALRAIEQEAARRKEQEDKDLALALQLDRELNLDDQPTPQPNTGNNSGMPGGW